MQWFKRSKKKIPMAAKAAGSSMKPNALTKQTVSNTDFKKWANNSTMTLQLNNKVLLDRAAFYKLFFQIITRYYPAASGAIWVWKNLCSTAQRVNFEGGSDLQKKQAKERVVLLDKRISPLKHVQGSGMDMLIAQFFHYVFTYGRFAGIMQVDGNFSRVDTFQIVDPFSVKFANNKTRTLYYAPDSKRPTEYIETNPHTFFYYGMNGDFENPYGIAMLESAWSVMKMAEEMRQDMLLSSSNAGLPRLHIKISQPDKDDTEDHEDYVTRVSTYFDSYVDNLSDIGPDDNFYTWDDVQIGVVGGHKGAGGFIWRNNHLVLDEEITSAFHLFPWVVGKSAQTTKNWVKSQFDLLMVEITALQRVAKRFAEWIRNTDLLLGGIHSTRSIHTFQTPRDPARKDTAIAERFEIENSERKVLNGVISPDTGARELGYDKAHDPKLIFEKDKSEAAKNPEHPQDRNNAHLENRLDELDDKIDLLNDSIGERFESVLSAMESNAHSNPFSGGSD